LPLFAQLSRGEEAFSALGLPVMPILGNYLCRFGFTRGLQRPDLGVQTQDDGVQGDLQVVRFFGGAQALRKRAGLVQLGSYLL